VTNQTLSSFGGCSGCDTGVRQSAAIPRSPIGNEARSAYYDDDYPASFTVPATKLEASLDAETADANHRRAHLWNMFTTMNNAHNSTEQNSVAATNVP
jgi:hypothetical protein